MSTVELSNNNLPYSNSKKDLKEELLDDKNPNNNHQNNNNQNNDSTTSSPSSSTNSSPNSKSHKNNNNEKNQLHSFDSKLMAGFYEACVGKVGEMYSNFQENWQFKDYPLNMSDKTRVYDLFSKFSSNNREPIVLLQNFNYGDLFTFEKFLQSLKQDGINSMSKYRSFLTNKDMKKFEVDLVLLHAKYGILLVDIKETDHLDYKKRSKIKSQLNSARSCLQSLVKLIMDAKGLPRDATVPITEIVALPNLVERPTNPTSNGVNQLQTQNQKPNPNASLRQLNFLVKSDLESPETLKSWWSQNVVEKLQSQPTLDKSLMNHLLGMIGCIKHNSIIPVVHQELDLTNDVVLNGAALAQSVQKQQEEKQQQQKDEKDNKSDKEKEKENGENKKDNYKLNVSAEFFHEKHDKVRSLSKVAIMSKDAEKLRHTVCLQTLWLLLNDSQKKISVICTEQNKAYYEEYFQRQRKIYSNLNNVRFYSDLQSFSVNNTLKKDNDVWFFDYDMSALPKDVVDRIKELPAFWIYTNNDSNNQSWKNEMQTLNVKYVDLDQVDNNMNPELYEKRPWLSGLHLKLPLRLQCDLLIIGDIISPNQLKMMYSYFSSGVKQSNGSHNNHYNNGNGHHYNVQHSQAAKKLKSIKFIRGGTIENIRKALKMHDSIQAQVVLLHVGDEDILKTKNAQSTIDNVKELTQLVKEYCPKSFVVLSTLMRRASKPENSITNDVNKGIINFCKQTRDASNFFYMLNNHFDPEYHTYEGRSLSNKGLKLYVENVLFVVDYFLVKNNKQH